MPTGCSTYTQPRAFISRLLSSVATLRSAFLGAAGWWVKAQGHRSDLCEVESVLSQHPTVGQCSVVPCETSSGETKFVAYVVAVEPKHNAVPSSYNAVEIWKAFWDDAHSRSGSVQNSGLNEIGELDSNSGAPYPSSPARETAARIRALNPARVLDIGCGTGTILFDVAPFCKSYIATDISGVALAHIRKALQEQRTAGRRISLRQQSADDFSGIAEGSLDLVVINSVAQYFPSIQYFVSVLEQAVKATREGGAVLVGDIRSMARLEGCPAPSCAEGMQQAALETQELAIDPTFFDAFSRRTLGISHVDLSMRRGLRLHELSRPRYDALLHVGGKAPEEVPVAWRQYVAQEHSPTCLADTFKVTGEISGFAAIPHGAIHPGGVDPEALWSFAKMAGYEIDIMWSTAGDPGVYDVVFRRGAMQQARASRPRSAPMPWDAYASEPTRVDTRSALISEWRQHLQQRLPEHRVPAEFAVVELLPCNAGGEFSRRVRRSPVPDHRPKEAVTTPGAVWF